MAQKDSAAGLNERQRAFCEEFLKFGVGAKAARAAGYSEKSAGCTATRLLKNANIRQYIADRLNKLAARYGDH